MQIKCSIEGIDLFNQQRDIKDLLLKMTQFSSINSDKLRHSFIDSLHLYVYQKGERVLLQNENINQELLVVVSIVSCRQAAPNMERYETRAEFMHLGSKLRETIIKYIFDEDRKIRKKDMGV